MKISSTYWPCVLSRPWQSNDQATSVDCLLMMSSSSLNITGTSKNITRLGKSILSISKVSANSISKDMANPLDRFKVLDTSTNSSHDWSVDL